MWETCIYSSFLRSWENNVFTSPHLYCFSGSWYVSHRYVIVFGSVSVMMAKVTKDLPNSFWECHNEPPNYFWEYIMNQTKFSWTSMTFRYHHTRTLTPRTHKPPIHFPLLGVSVHLQQQNKLKKTRAEGKKCHGKSMMIKKSRWSAKINT